MDEEERGGKAEASDNAEPTEKLGATTQQPLDRGPTAAGASQEGRRSAMSGRIRLEESKAGEEESLRAVDGAVNVGGVWQHAADQRFTLDGFDSEDEFDSEEDELYLDNDMYAAESSAELSNVGDGGVGRVDGEDGSVVVEHSLRGRDAPDSEVDEYGRLRVEDSQSGELRNSDSATQTESV